jgi:hypothetical protein
MRFVLLMFLVSAPAFASGLTPVKGSCQPAAAAGWCGCRAVDDYGGRHAGVSYRCNQLQCDDYKPEFQPANCGGENPPQYVTCVLSHSGYGSDGICLQGRYVSEGQTQYDACSEVRECLNDRGCVKSYCNSTTIRENWSLLEIRARW